MKHKVHLICLFKLEMCAGRVGTQNPSTHLGCLEPHSHVRDILRKSKAIFQDNLRLTITTPAWVIAVSILLGVVVLPDPVCAVDPRAPKDQVDRKLSKLKRAQFHLQRGVRHYVKKRYSEAVKEFTLAIRLSPKHSKLYYNRANAYFRLKSYKAAIDDYSEAVRRNPQFVLAWANLGNALSATNQLDAALNAFEAAGKLEPNNPYVLFNRGFVYGKRREYHSAIKDFTKLLERHPNDVKALALRASAYQAVGEIGKAEEDLKKMRKLNPTNPRFRLKD